MAPTGIRSSWLVPVTALRRGRSDRQEEHRQGHLGELRVADTTVPADAVTSVDVVLSTVHGGIEVAGTVATRWEGECRRCLRTIGGDLLAEVRELYRQRDAGEADDEDEETYPLGGDQLDLEPLARDAVLLGLPLAPLCRPDCAGLCPTCGADLSDGACGCPPAAGDPRWGMLDLLRPGRDAEGPETS